MNIRNIDHIFVSRFGVFVVETKNMQGGMFGGEHQTVAPEGLQEITQSPEPAQAGYKIWKHLRHCLMYHRILFTMQTDISKCI
ncbi:nuclease-related domain-containing protein [Microbulbifer sp. ARAS458-1]|uniref:nuclease-related domain-containing protein n=1 Tax=Microbulbifer sp. ARAS458-1 TaxID=3140242 RepID=UPI0038780778